MYHLNTLDISESPYKSRISAYYLDINCSFPLKAFELRHHIGCRFGDQLRHRTNAAQKAAFYEILSKLGTSLTAEAAPNGTASACMGKEAMSANNQDSASCRWASASRTCTISSRLMGYRKHSRNATRARQPGMANRRIATPLAMLWVTSPMTGPMPWKPQSFRPQPAIVAAPPAASFIRKDTTENTVASVRTWFLYSSTSQTSKQSWMALIWRAPTSILESTSTTR